MRLIGALGFKKALKEGMKIKIGTTGFYLQICEISEDKVCNFKILHNPYGSEETIELSEFQIDFKEKGLGCTGGLEQLAAKWSHPYRKNEVLSTLDVSFFQNVVNICEFHFYYTDMGSKGYIDFKIVF